MLGVVHNSFLPDDLKNDFEFLCCINTKGSQSKYSKDKLFF
jgi:hypothetical protein